MAASEVPVMAMNDEQSEEKGLKRQSVNESINSDK